MIPSDDRILSPREVAIHFGVDAKTVSRWSQRGLIKSFRTPGGHRRFYLSEVREMMETKADG